MLRHLAVVGLLVNAALAIAGVAGAASATPSTPISPVTTEVILMLSGRRGQASAPIVVNNTGAAPDLVTPTVTIDAAAPTSTLTFSATPACAGLAASPSQLVLCPGLSTVQVTATVHDARAYVGQLGLQDVSGTAVVQLDIRRSPPGSLLSLVIAASALLAFAIVVVAWVSAVYFDGWKPARTKRPVGLFSPLAEAADWKFTDSWASTLTVLGATLGTALNLTGLFSSSVASVPVIAPGVSPVAFLILNIVCAALVLVAPAIFAALPKKDVAAADPGKGTAAKKTVGTTLGFALASGLVLGAALLQLATLYLLIWMIHPGGHLTGVFGLVIGAAAAVVVAYGVATVSSALRNGRTYDVSKRDLGSVRVATLLMSPEELADAKTGKRAVLP